MFVVCGYVCQRHVKQETRHLMHGTCVVSYTAKGEVYSWGSGSYGQLGYGVAGNLVTSRLILTADKKIADISAGRYHSLALTSFGKLCTCYVCARLYVYECIVDVTPYLSI